MSNTLKSSTTKTTSSQLNNGTAYSVNNEPNSRQQPIRKTFQPNASSSTTDLSTQFGEMSLNSSKRVPSTTLNTKATTNITAKNGQQRSGSSVSNHDNNNSTNNSLEKAASTSGLKKPSQVPQPPLKIGARTTSLQIEDAEKLQSNGNPSAQPSTLNGATTTSSNGNNGEPVQVNGNGEASATTFTFQSANGAKCTILYNPDKEIGRGSFGAVYQARIVESGEPVAIKKVLQDKRFKNRELQIMKLVKHRNIVEMKHCFYTTGSKTSTSEGPSEELYLNLVLEYVPDTVFRFCCQHTKNNTYVPIIYVKLFIFQLCRALNYIHYTQICHRDIKPQNLLIDPVTGVLKLCDFGSAKQLVKGEPNVSYICSRYYRAPELIFGATNYTTAIDIWSMGCVMGELLIGQPLFPGESSVDQLVEIIRVLGTPTKEEIDSMNKNYIEFKFPVVKPHPWTKVFQERKPPPEAIDLITKFLQYNPRKRIKPLDALAHPFFDELRDPKAKLPSGRPLPPLFDFTADELKTLSNPDLKFKIIPPHHRKE